MHTIAIVGVGLIGGSFARALRHYGFPGRILGVSSETTLRRALDLGVIDEGAPLSEALAQADLVMLAQPISQILSILEQLDLQLLPGTLITDVGSTKRQIVAVGERSIKRGVFLGGHPMAGKEQRGVEHSDPFLFAQRPWYLAPSSPALLSVPRVEEFTGWLRRMGAVPVPITADDHDELVSFTSHLPQLLSTSLAALLAERLLPERVQSAAGPGLQDMTRLANSSYEIWRDILETNADHVAVALDHFLDRLSGLRRQLPERAGIEGQGLAAEFEIACNFAKALRKTHI